MARRKKVVVEIPTEATPVMEATIDPEMLPNMQPDPMFDAGAMVLPEEPPVEVPPTPLPPAPVIAPPPPVEPETLPPDFKLARKAHTLGDVLTGVAKFPTVVEKCAWLQHNASKSLWYVLNLAFNQKRVWLLPTGIPPYKPHKGRPGSSPSDLRMELRRLYVFLEGGNDNLSAIRRQKLFQQTIEGLDPTEVLALVAMKDHTMPETFGLPEAVVERAFPGLLATDFPIKFIK